MSHLYRRAVAHLPFIDGLRALAVLAVVLYHVDPSWLPGGFMGVDIFFVISGFVVTLSMRHLPHAGLGAFLAEFYARRARRILPALIACIVTTAVLSALFIPKAWLSEANSLTAAGALFGVGNMVLAHFSGDYFSPQSEFNPYTHTWSLGIEEQFYLLVPLLLWPWARSGRTGRVAAIVGTACLLSLVLAALNQADRPSSTFYMLPFRFWELGAGVLLALHLDPATTRSASARLQTASCFAAAAALAAALALGDSGRFPWPWALVPVAATTLLIAMLMRQSPTSPLRHLLSHPLPVFVGRISYSVYLWHWPVIVLMRWTVGLDTPSQQALALGLSLLLGYLSFRFVETPLRRGRADSTRRRTLLTGIGASSLACVALLALTLQHDRISLSVTARSQDWSPSTPVPVDMPHCQVSMSTQSLGEIDLRSLTPEHCRSASTEPLKHRLWVIGDSHAAAYQGLLHALVAQQGLQVEILQKPGCPFLNLRRPLEEESDRCRSFIRAAAARVAEQAHPGDQVFLPSLRLARLGDQWGPKAPPATEPPRPEREQRIIDEAVDVLSLMIRSGAMPLLEMPKPIFPAPAFRCSDWFNQNNPACRGGLSIERAEIEAMRAPVLARMQALQQRLPGLRLWDPLPTLCPDSVCRALQDGRPLFFDGDHVSGYGNSLLMQSLATEFILGTSQRSVSNHF